MDLINQEESVKVIISVWMLSHPKYQKVRSDELIIQINLRLLLGNSRLSSLVKQICCYWFNLSKYKKTHMQ